MCHPMQSIQRPDETLILDGGTVGMATKFGAREPFSLASQLVRFDGWGWSDVLLFS